MTVGCIYMYMHTHIVVFWNDFDVFVQAFISIVICRLSPECMFLTSGYNILCYFCYGFF